MARKSRGIHQAYKEWAPSVNLLQQKNDIIIHNNWNHEKKKRVDHNCHKKNKWAPGNK